MSSRPAALAAALADDRGAEHPGVQKHTCTDAAVDMHFVVAWPAGCEFDIEEHRRKGHRDRGRGQHHLAEQCQRVGVAAAGNQPHVPDHEARHVQVGGADVQAPAALVRFGHAAQQLGIDMPRDQRLQRARVGQRFTDQQLPQHGRAELEDVDRARGGVELAQGIVVVGSDEGEGRHQRARRHPGDDLEGRARPVALQPLRKPAPKAPLAPPPDSARWA